MIIMIALLGLFVGLLLVWASDYLPRYSVCADKPSTKRTLISPLHIATVLLSAAAFVLLDMRFGPSLNLVFFATIFSFLLLIAVIDLKHRLVLNVLTYPAIAIVIVGQLVLAQHNLLSVLLGGILAFGIFFLTARLRPGDLGGGDIKLATLIGLAFGFPGVLWALIVGAGAGALVAVALSATRRPGTKLYFAYAPYLCAGAIVALLYSPFVTMR